MHHREGVSVWEIEWWVFWWKESTFKGEGPNLRHVRTSDFFCLFIWWWWVRLFLANKHLPHSCTKKKKEEKKKKENALPFFCWFFPPPIGGLRTSYRKLDFVFLICPNMELSTIRSGLFSTWQPATREMRKLAKLPNVAEASLHRRLPWQLSPMPWDP